MAIGQFKGNMLQLLNRMPVDANDTKVSQTYTKLFLCIHTIKE